jgi:hypothetical protein
MLAARLRRLAVLATVGVLLALAAVVVSGSASAASSRRDTPIRVVHAAGHTLKIWAVTKHQSCWRHAYGDVRNFVSTQECGNSLGRMLITTRVNGRGVGLARYTCAFGGATAQQMYTRAGEFRHLVSQNGTGMFYSLFHDGYGLPAGPQAVPGSNAFRALSQDSGVWIFQAWYLHGATPNNAPALERLEKNLFLQF